jgi:hypothetical protein
MMKNLGFIAVIFVLSTGFATRAGAQGETASPDSGLVLVVEIGSRLYPDWHEEQNLRMNQMFYLGDSEFTARIEGFVPDFRIIDKKIVNMSTELKNPAAQVVVYHDTTATDSTWAFLNFPPHYSPQSFFTFQLKEIQGYEEGSVPVWTPPPAAATEVEPASSPEDSSLAKPKEDEHE